MTWLEHTIEQWGPPKSEIKDDYRATYYWKLGSNYYSVSLHRYLITYDGIRHRIHVTAPGKEVDYSILNDGITDDDVIEVLRLVWRDVWSTP